MSEEASVPKQKTAAAKSRATAHKTGASVDPGIALIRELAETLCEYSLTELKMEREGLRVSLSRSGGIAVAGPSMTALPVAAASAGPPESETPDSREGDIDMANHPGVVKAPMVGTVYLSPEPGAPVFVKEGDDVREGQTLLLVEAMKTFNAVSASRAGRLTRILAGDGQPVEYGEPLLIIE